MTMGREGEKIVDVPLAGPKDRNRGCFFPPLFYFLMRNCWNGECLTISLVLSSFSCQLSVQLFVYFPTQGPKSYSITWFLCSSKSKGLLCWYPVLALLSHYVIRGKQQKQILLLHWQCSSACFALCHLFPFNEAFSSRLGNSSSSASFTD